jgi:predicted permease
MPDALWQELRQAVRALAQRPVLTFVAIASLALGIGTSTAIFSIVDRLLLQRLPVDDPDRIVLVTSPGPRPGSASNDNSGGPAHIFSYPLFRDLEALDDTGLAALAGHRVFAVNLAHEGVTERGDGLLVSGSYFPALGLTAASGRLFTREDDRVTGGHPIVVLSHRFWTRRFAADPRVIGETFTVNGEALTIVGVTPSHFDSTTAMEAPDVYVPLAMAERLRAGSVERNSHWIYVFGRLAPGVSMAQAQARLSVPFASLIREVEFPAQRRGLGDRDREAFLARRIVLEPGAQPRNDDRAEIGPLLGAILAGTGLVLLIACANVANLVLARATARSAEMAVRLSLGASRGRVLRLFLIEAALLGVLGGIGALVVAPAATGGLLSLMPADDQTMLAFDFNRRLLFYALGVGLATSALFGIVPVLQAMRGLSAGAVNLQSSRVSATRSTNRVRSGLATAQIALSLLLLAQAGLFASSLANISDLDLGLRPEGLLTFRLSPFLNGYEPEQAVALAEALKDDMGALPGVTAVTASTIPLLASNASSRNVTIEGFTADADFNTRVSFAAAGANYFSTLGVRLLAGRDFARGDGTNARRVAVVNQAFARKFNLGSDVIGRRVALGEGTIPLDIEIVGLAADAQYSEVIGPAPPLIVVPARQAPFGSLTFDVRVAADPESVLAAIPGLVQRHDPALPIERLYTLNDQIWDNITRERVVATLSSSFALFATLLAGIGLYGILAYTIAQRTRELGVRMAMGAAPLDVVRLVARLVGRIVGTGTVVGLAAAVGLGRLSQALLVGIDGYDPVVFGGAVAIILAMALAATLLPARRAASLDPVQALRME